MHLKGLDPPCRIVGKRQRGKDDISADPKVRVVTSRLSLAKLFLQSVQWQFAQLVLIPEGALVENVKAFLLLFSIVNMFLDEDQAVRQVDLLEQMVRDHFLLCLQLYGFGIMKIKPHLLFHICKSMRTWGVAPNCCVCERWHKIPKAIWLQQEPSYGSITSRPGLALYSRAFHGSRTPIQQLGHADPTSSGAKICQGARRVAMGRPRVHAG